MKSRTVDVLVVSSQENAEHAALGDTSCYAALTLMLKDVYTACMGVTAAKRCLKKFAVSRAVEFPDANFEIWKTSALSKSTKTIDNAQRARNISVRTTSKDTWIRMDSRHLRPATLKLAGRIII
jgi:hypothetical protein